MITWKLGFWSTWTEREWFIFSITKDNFLFLKGITLAIFQVLGKFQIHYKLLGWLLIIHFLKYVDYRLEIWLYSRTLFHFISLKNDVEIYGEIQNSDSYMSHIFFQRTLETSLLLITTYLMIELFENNVRAIGFVHVCIRKSYVQSIIAFPTS